MFVPGAASQELGPGVGLRHAVLRLALEACHRQEHRTHLALPDGAAAAAGTWFTEGCWWYGCWCSGAGW